VWMHIPPSQRTRSMRKLTNLLKSGGKIVISLKFGMSKQEQQERRMYDVSVEEVERLAQNLGLFAKLESAESTDKLNREGIYWQTVVLQMPDDGTGAFPFIRHVAINDGKSATHKLALLRILLRIARWSSWRRFAQRTVLRRRQGDITLGFSFFVLDPSI
jgi:hypothetical protein